MTGAVVISWGGPVRGREATGMEVFGKAVAHFAQLEKQGRIHAHREFFALTGRAGGFMLIEGQVEELQRVMTEPEQRRLLAQAQQIVEDFRTKTFLGGSDATVQEAMTNYAGALQELGLV